MGTFVHDLIDPGAHWCPDCGEPRGVCQCDKEYPTRTYIAFEWDDDDEFCPDCGEPYALCDCNLWEAFDDDN